jgi:hypothetical protein
LKKKSKAILVIYTSVYGRGDWHPLHEHEVPEWVKAPDVMGQLVAGQMCIDAAQGDRGSNWYRAERIATH